MRHGWSALWRAAIGFTAFLRFLTDMRCYENFLALSRVSAKTEIWNSCEYQFNVKIWKLRKTWKYKNLTI